MSRMVKSWIVGFFLLLSAGTADAQIRAEPRPSLDRILPQIRAHHPGKFYDAEGPWRGGDGQWRYRLKWMAPDGRIIWFDADARSGRVLGPDPGYGEIERPRFRESGRFIPFDERPWRRAGRPPRGGRGFFARPHGRR